MLEQEQKEEMYLISYSSNQIYQIDSESDQKILKVEARAEISDKKLLPRKGNSGKHSGKDNQQRHDGI